MNQANDQISIILIAYHSDDWLPNCIASLKNKIPKESLHLILIDNSGNQNINKVSLKEFSSEIIKTPYAMGFAEANNFALTNANRLGATVLFLNQDTVSQEGWIGKCLKVLENHPNIGAISPVIRNYDDTSWDTSFLECLTEKEVSTKEIIYVDNAPAAALIVRTDLLRKVGPFDPVYGSYYEDYDLCRRIKQAGYEIAFCRNAVIQHYSGSATNSKERVLERMRNIIRNKVIYEARNYSGFNRRLFLLKQFCIKLPHRLMRGFIGTSSSQPPIAVLKASFDILKLSRRLISDEVDRQKWKQYLEEIRWR